mmetsp:Transcript_35965/g.66066  ORF Transcript_35965/g.66066 Transcript_35965/m.66066 type:complete len:465 (+) Transcript_35965:87-1481(+)
MPIMHRNLLLPFLLAMGVATRTATAEALRPAVAFDDVQFDLCLLQKKADAAGQPSPCIEAASKAGALPAPTKPCDCSTGKSKRQSSKAHPCSCEETSFQAQASVHGLALSLLQELRELRDEPLFGRTAQLYTDYTYNRGHGASMADILMVIFLVLAVILNVFLVVSCWVLARAGDKPPGSSIRTLVKNLDLQQKLEERNNWLSATAKYALRHFDSTKFGVEVSIGSLAIDSENGTVLLTEVSIANLKDYKMPCIVRVPQVRLTLDMDKLITSRGEDVCVNEVMVEDVSIVVEKAGNSTNVADLMAILTKADQAGFKQPTKGANSSSGESGEQVVPCGSIFAELKGDDKADPPGPPQLSIRRVDVKRMHAKAGWLILAAVASEIPVPGIVYDDFEREVASAWRADTKDVDVVVLPFFIMLMLRTVADTMCITSHGVAGTVFDVPLRLYMGDPDYEQASEDDQWYG